MQLLNSMNYSHFHLFRSSFAGRLLCAILLIISLNGCATIKDFFNFENQEEIDLQFPAEQLVIKGMDEFNVGKYFKAIEYFDEILTKYPFSTQATLAELKAADCNYYLEKYVEAYILYKDFEERHPTNDAVPYVMYQKGMCNYKRIDRIDRDISGAMDAIENFNQLLKAYPNSPYTDKVKARIKAANEFLVNHEYSVVQFYLRSEKYSQAEARLKYLIAAHPNTSITPRAEELLHQIQEGEPPSSSIINWITDLSLPNWTLFTDDEEVSTDQKK